jgi:4-hydroxybenzoate polyprenyltransferase
MFRKAFFSVLDYLLFSNIFIAFCAVAQGLVTYFLLKLPANHYVLAILFCGTLVIYNLSILLAKPKSPQNSAIKRVRWVFSHLQFIKHITFMAGACLIPLGLFFLSFETQLLMLFIGIIAVAYNYPFFQINQQNIALRNIPGIKLFLIAFVWSVSGVILPIICLQNSLGITVALTDVFFLFTQRFLFICAITIPFDIRDLFQDKYYQLKTIPVIWGKKKALFFCRLLLVAYLISLVFFKQEIEVEIVALAITILVTAGLISKSSFQKNEYYYLLFLDGTMILQLVVLWASSFFR